MSSESRVKKLRGSGGYIMANITEDQQRKGNLGGPDLFLAPIGRIDSSKISKHHCNSCEKDYEGSPKIDYENPNEEVAENLILVEKGKYLCNTCNSTIAEYREFKKPDQGEDVGLAKSDSGSFSSPPPPEPAQEKPAKIEPAEPVQKPQHEPQSSPPPKVEQVTPPQPPPVEPKVQPQDTAKSNQLSSVSVSSVIGMEVFDENVKRVGTVKQMGVDSSQSVVLIVAKNDGSEVNIKWNQIKKIGEIILLGSQDGSPQTTSTSGSRCSSCGFDNKSGSKFCENCGSRI